MTKDIQLIYVSNNAESLVREVNLASGKIAGTAQVGNRPRTIVLSPN